MLIEIIEPVPVALQSFLEGQYPCGHTTHDGIRPRKRRKVEGVGAESPGTSNGARKFLTLARADVNIVCPPEIRERNELLITQRLSPKNLNRSILPCCHRPVASPLQNYRFKSPNLSKLDTIRTSTMSTLVPYRLQKVIPSARRPYWVR